MNEENTIQDMTISQLQKTVDTWIKTVGVRYFSPLTNMAVLAEETYNIGICQLVQQTG